MVKLPSNKRRDIEAAKASGIRVWLYSAPFVGKTTFADKWPNPINLNTDGNIKYVTMPYISITDRDGLSAWDVFVQTVDLITSGKHDFETIVVDLVDDIYQHAREHYASKEGWVHESDLGFGRGYDIIREAYYAQLRRLSSSGYNVIYASHTNEKTVKSRTGKESTIYTPNLPDKVANKVAGMVDIVARAYVDVEENEDGTITENRLMRLTATSDEFSGGRLQGLAEKPIELEYEVFMKQIEDALGYGVEVTVDETPVEEPAEEPAEKVADEKPPIKETSTPRRTRLT